MEFEFSNVCPPYIIGQKEHDFSPSKINSDKSPFSLLFLVLTFWNNFWIDTGVAKAIAVPSIYNHANNGTFENV